MNIKETMEALLAGKRVVRSSLSGDTYLELIDGEIVNEQGYIEDLIGTAVYDIYKKSKKKTVSKKEKKDYPYVEYAPNRRRLEELAIYEALYGKYK